MIKKIIIITIIIKTFINACLLDVHLSSIRPSTIQIATTVSPIIRLNMIKSCNQFKVR